MERYGIGTDKSGKATAGKGADMTKLAAAAHELVVADAAVANLQIRLNQKYKTESGPVEEQQALQSAQKKILADPEYITAVEKYEMLFAKHRLTFPILAAYKGKPAELNALSQAQKSPAAAALAKAEVDKKRESITTTRTNIKSGKLSLYGLPNIVSVAKTNITAPPGSLKARFVDDKVASIKADKAIVDAALTAIAVAALVVANVATAGGAAVLAGGAIGVGLGISGARTLESIGNTTPPPPLATPTSTVRSPYRQRTRRCSGLRSTSPCSPPTWCRRVRCSRLRLRPFESSSACGPRRARRLRPRMR